MNEMKSWRSTRNVVDEIYMHHKNLRSGLFIVCALACGLRAFGMTNADVIKMVDAGLGTDVILAAVIGASERKFETSADHLIALKTARVPDSVLAAMVAPPPVRAAPISGVSLTQGCYFLRGGVVSRGDALAEPELRVGGKAFIPFASLGNVPVYAWFNGANASRVVERGDQIVVVGWDVKPQLVKFFIKEGRRYSTLTKRGMIIEESLVKNCDFSRDNNNHWTATLPEDFAAGEYWVMVPIQGRETPAFDFRVR